MSAALSQVATWDTATTPSATYSRTLRWRRAMCRERLVTLRSLANSIAPVLSTNSEVGADCQRPRSRTISRR
eukprot:scaffold11416_cov119-Isochrysis_galbana.AAC.10